MDLLQLLCCFTHLQLMQLEFTDQLGSFFFFNITGNDFSQITALLSPHIGVLFLGCLSLLFCISLCL